MFKWGLVDNLKKREEERVYLAREIWNVGVWIEDIAGDEGSHIAVRFEKSTAVMNWRYVLVCRRMGGRDRLM